MRNSSLAPRRSHNSFLGVQAETRGRWPRGVDVSAGVDHAADPATNGYRRIHDAALLAACILGGAMAYLIFALSLWIFRYYPSNQFFATLLGLAAVHVDMESAREWVRAARARTKPARRRMPVAA